MHFAEFLDRPHLLCRLIAMPPVEPADHHQHDHQHHDPHYHQPDPLGQLKIIELCACYQKHLSQPPATARLQADSRSTAPPCLPPTLLLYLPGTCENRAPTSHMHMFSRAGSTRLLSTARRVKPALLGKKGKRHQLTQPFAGGRVGSACREPRQNNITKAGQTRRARDK